MKTNLLSLLILLLANVLWGQSTVSGLVLNATSKAPIPYVNIGVKNESLGTVSDNDGQFSLKNVPSELTLTFSSIGYESLDLKVAEMTEGQSIELTPIEYEIESVEIKATRFNGAEKRFGLKNETRGPIFAYGNPQLGTELGALIRIDKPTYIKSANFVLNHAKGDSILLRLKIYDYKDEVIGENILTENILIQEKQRKGVISIDMTPYNLILNGNVLFALEWIRNFDELGNKGITFDVKKGKKLKGVWLRSNSQNEFFKLPMKPRWTPCFFFIGKQSE